MNDFLALKSNKSAKIRRIQIMRGGARKGAGRPRGSYKQLDLERLRTLAMIGMPVNKMARALETSHDTLDKHYRDVIEQARGDGETRILGKIFQLALNGNVRCLELCAINRCGWANRPEVMVNVTQNTLALDTRSPEAIKAHLVELQKAVLEEAKRFELNGNGESLDSCDGAP